MALTKDFLPVIGKVVTEGGGKFLARGGKVVSVQGAPASPRIVVAQFDNLDKMQALFDSAAFKQAIALGNKYATQRIVGVEGVSP
jgi:uncharacterized protein (DUF1330 family)